MPPSRQLLSALHAIRSRQLASRSLRQHGIHLSRSCSCSAPHQDQQVIVSSERPFKTKVNTKVNATSTPPTPPADHQTLAQRQNLFITSPYSPGSPLILPNGAYVFQKLQAFLRAQYPQFGFQEVVTPIIYKKSLWEQSGHWENYAEDMFSVQGRSQLPEGESEGEFGLKPMNCPGHCLLFKDQQKTHRDMPIRYADFSALHRNEVSGALSGLTRVRRFHQDDAHIFCRRDQILEEIEQTLKFIAMVYNTFGLGPFKLLLSTRPEESFIGTVEEWDQAEQQLTTALNNIGSDWAISEGDGAFYGPKIDVILKDSNGKEHQTATIQLDFQLPQRFDLQYKTNSEEQHAQPQTSMDAGLDEMYRRPVIIHRAIYGSIERFMALLIEHYAGKYPLWLSPRPAIILPLYNDPKIHEQVLHFQSVLSGLKPPSAPATPSLSDPKPLPLSTIHLPVDIDTREHYSLGKRIVEARLKGYNHIMVVGDKEAATGAVNLTISNQPNEKLSIGILEEIRGRGLTDSERSKNTVNIGVDVARKYFESLVNSFL